MYNRPILLASLLLVFLPAFSQSRKYVIAVIGSSTAQGVGANPIDSSWVNRTKYYFQNLGKIDTIYNIALGGQTTYDGMPTSFVPPAGRPTPDTATNVTKALSFNPDVVLVNFPSNDAAADYSLAETMSNLRILYNTIVKAGKIAYITTSEPRTSLATVQKELLKTMRDSVEAEFGVKSLDFYDAIVGPDSLDINPIYNFDGTHVNNAGHEQLFEVVRNANILPEVQPPPVLGLLDFTATPEGDKVELAWTLTGVSQPTTVVIQRSLDGKDFIDLDQQTLQPTPATDSSSWMDNQPLAGERYYRLEFSDDSQWLYSPVVPVDIAVTSWGIGNVATTTGQETQAQILCPATANGTVSVFNTAGQLVFRQSLTLTPPSVLISIPTTGWPGGEYILHVVTNQGNKATKAFMKW